MTPTMYTAIDLTYRAGSLAAVIADLAGTIDELSGKNAAIDKKRLGQIITLAEIIEGYSKETSRRLEAMAREKATGGCRPSNVT